MSANANPDLAHLWLDGDAWRAPANTAMPATILDGTALDDAEYIGWDAYGGIKAGFKISKTSNSTPLQIWNGDGDYKVKKDPDSVTVEFLPVDESKATILTALRGGSITETATGAGLYEHVQGEDEEFSLLLRAKDGDEFVFYYMARCTLNDPPEEDHNADLTGFPISVKPLTPSDGGKSVRKFRNSNPLAA